MITLGDIIIAFQAKGFNASYDKMLYIITSWLSEKSGNIDVFDVTWQDAIHVKAWAPLFQRIGVEIGADFRLHVVATGENDDDITCLVNALVNTRRTYNR